MNHPAVVMDCGSGFTKLGLSGSVGPSDVLPTVIAYDQASHSRGKPSGLEHMDYVIGEPAATPSGTRQPRYPVRCGLVHNWDDIERFWAGCIHQRLRCRPQDHALVLTEPPLAPPETREQTAEIMFETFGVQGLYIGVQAVMALYASLAMEGRVRDVKASTGLTGVVVDSGEGVTHVVPVVDGYVIESGIKSIPLAGRAITTYVQVAMRERDAGLPPELAMAVARRMKEEHGYVCGNLHNELLAYQADEAGSSRHYSGVRPQSGQEFTASMGYERFVGPELLFSPGILKTDFDMPLSRTVHDVIQGCPIDTRRALSGNIVLSGGTTMFKGFAKRLKRDLKALSAAHLPPGSTPVDIEVHSHKMQAHAAWFGGSLMGMSPQFGQCLKTREMYEEYGPSICRTNYVYKE